MTEANTAQKPTDGDHDRHWDLLWNTQLGVRYHMHLQSCYARFGKFVTAFSLVMGSAAFGSFFQTDNGIGQWLTFAVVLAQTLELVIDSKAKTILHISLRQQYLQLELELSGRDFIFSDEERALKAKKTAIEVEEPPVIKALMDRCNNELATVYKLGDEYKVNLTWLQARKADLYS